MTKEYCYLFFISERFLFHGDFLKKRTAETDLLMVLIISLSRANGQDCIARCKSKPQKSTATTSLLVAFMAAKGAMDFHGNSVNRGNPRQTGWSLL